MRPHLRRGKLRGGRSRPIARGLAKTWACSSSSPRDSGVGPEGEVRACRPRPAPAIRAELDGLLVEHPELATAASRAERWSGLAVRARIDQGQSLAGLEDDVPRAEGKERAEVVAQGRQPGCRPSCPAWRSSEPPHLPSRQTDPMLVPYPRTWLPTPEVTSIHVRTTPEMAPGPQFSVWASYGARIRAPPLA